MHETYSSHAFEEAYTNLYNAAEALRTSISDYKGLKDFNTTWEDKIYDLAEIADLLADDNTMLMLATEKGVTKRKQFTQATQCIAPDNHISIICG